MDAIATKIDTFVSNLNAVYKELKDMVSSEAVAKILNNRNPEDCKSDLYELLVTMKETLINDCDTSLIKQTSPMYPTINNLVFTFAVTDVAKPVIDILLKVIKDNEQIH